MDERIANGETALNDLAVLEVLRIAGTAPTATWADSGPNEAPVPCASEQVPVGEVLEQSFAEARIHRPEATRLCHGELEPWHLVVFGHDPIRNCAQL